MSLGPNLFSVLLTATPYLHGSCWRSSRIPLRVIAFRFRSSVVAELGTTEEMLGRAAKEYCPPLKQDLRKSFISSNTPVQTEIIDDQFRKSAKSTELHLAIKNPTTTLQRTHVRSPILTPYNKASSPLSRISGVRALSTSESLFTAVSKQESFQSIKTSTVIEQKGTMSSNFGNQIFEINEDDFDDDDDLDLDNNLELPKPGSELSKPLSNSHSYYSNKNSTKTPNENNSTLNDPSSSIVNWSSSPPSHKLNPWLVREARKRETGGMTSEDSSDPIRPIKRRTLPWLQKQAEDDLLNSGRDDGNIERPLVSSQAEDDPLLNMGDHQSETYPPSTEITPRQSTPLQIGNGDKRMPWNNTGDTIKEEKKKLKDKNRETKKNDESLANFDAHNLLQPKLSMIPLSLSEEQKRVLDLVINQSKSVFFTGSAGTGKSVLMRAIIAELRKRFSREPDRVAVTASTGLAACNIGGVTLHSFGGIGLGKDDVPTLVRKIKRNAKAKNRWIRTKVLIIDEISMVDGDLFDKLESVARAMRNNGRPFGGIQLVITGDFFQLPPVPEYDNKSKGIKFAFDACTWSTSLHHTIGLTQVFRQKDPEFASMLNEMRLGKMTDKTVTEFKSLSRKVPTDGFEATEL